MKTLVAGRVLDRDVVRDAGVLVVELDLEGRAGRGRIGSVERDVQALIITEALPPLGAGAPDGALDAPAVGPLLAGAALAGAPLAGAPLEGAPLAGPGGGGPLPWTGANVQPAWADEAQPASTIAAIAAKAARW